MAAILHNRHLLVPYLSTLQVANLEWQAQGAVCRPFLSSDLNFLLDYMAGLASDDSDDDLDRYLLSDDKPDQTEDGNNQKLISNELLSYYIQQKIFSESVVLCRNAT